MHALGRIDLSFIALIVPDDVQDCSIYNLTHYNRVLCAAFLVSFLFSQSCLLIDFGAIAVKMHFLFSLKFFL